MRLAKPKHNRPRLGDEFEELKVGERSEHIDRRAETAAEQDEKFVGASRGARDTFHLTGVAQPLACKRIHGLLFIGEDLNVAATGSQEISGVFGQTADQDEEVALMQQIGDGTAVGLTVLAGRSECQGLVALQEIAGGAMESRGRAHQLIQIYDRGFEGNRMV